ncbi:ThuA domain-containing protein, partial [Sphaerisporangium melleum]|uniref:ThuA domain-containing protein n=1 Tax=Sphaerisporangium melleum TaxID=321316 RepID=UPI0035EDA325
MLRHPPVPPAEPTPEPAGVSASALGSAPRAARRGGAWRRVALAAVALATAAAAAVTALPALPAQAAAYKVLVFSKTAGFRHDSIPNGIQAIRELGNANDFTVDTTEDAGTFTTSNLAQYKAVIWLS